MKIVTVAQMVGIEQAADAAAACERMLEQGKQRHARFQQRDDAEDARARLAAEG